MKFVIAVVVLVCALAGVQASGWGASPWAGAWAGPGAWNGAWNGAHGWNGAWNGAHGWNGAWDNGAWNGGAWGGPWGWNGGIHGISLNQGPHAAALPTGHGGHGGVYVAKTRGAIHTAPLAGHINSATSLNVAAAPGTL